MFLNIKHSGNGITAGIKCDVARHSDVYVGHGSVNESLYRMRLYRI